MSALRARMLLLLLMSSGCANEDVIHCDVDSDCIQGSIPGRCLPVPSSSSQWCAFPDSSCPSENRWGVKTGDGLARECVDGPPSSARHILSVTLGPGGSVTSEPAGVDCGSDCVEAFASDATVVLSATPAQGKSLVGWGGDCAPARLATTSTLTMTKDRVVSAAFAAPGTVLSLQSFGSAANEHVDGLAIDSTGHVYVAGHFADMLTIGGNVLIGLGGQQDIFVAKLSATGDVVWAKAFGGPATEQALNASVDRDGNLWLVGFFSGSINFGGGRLDSANAQDGFVAKLNGVDGGHLLSQKLGPAAYAIAHDPLGNTYITGAFGDPFDVGGTHLPSAGSSDVYLVKFNADGHQQFALDFGGLGNESPAGLVVDADGNAVLTGTYSASVNFGSGTLPDAGSADAFVAKLSPGGNCIWARGLGGAGQDAITSIAADTERGIYVAGYFEQTVNFGGGAVASKGGKDVFVLKYDKSGTYQWSATAGGPGDDLGAGLALDRNDEPVVAGNFGAIASFGSVTVVSAGDSDVFAAKLSASAGAIQWVTRMGGSAFDAAQFIVESPASGHAIVAGSFASTAAFGHFGATASGSDDVFLAVLLP